ncbi:hypothetical protein RF11_01132 [Thelohanellus kitauei]|uniref:Uncharacterized protein n=1 Tax=Thelohanellus kitauei TaxID=669202 RepID=A0A0C2J595_THEKT|nr:hypothetical protein RF11_01132 [Thelohanellus kitauei]
MQATVVSISSIKPNKNNGARRIEEIDEDMISHLKRRMHSFKLLSLPLDESNNIDETHICSSFGINFRKHAAEFYVFSLPITPDFEKEPASLQTELINMQ